ncbi:MAG: integration host factor subunit alpha [Magnetococcales bacterium]|nr:integration host factor subunit alpha [Magnetococcales bacterium]
MTKADIVEAVYRKIGLTKKESAGLVEEVLEIVREELEGTRPVKLSGFGNFNIRSKGPRPGRNPKTGEEIEITARKVLTFKASQILKDRVNSAVRA